MQLTKIGIKGHGPGSKSYSRRHYSDDNKNNGNARSCIKSICIYYDYSDSCH